MTGEVATGVPGACTPAALTFFNPTAAPAPPCNASAPLAPSIAVFETGLSLSSPTQCWSYDNEASIPVSLEIRASAKLAITKLTLGYIDHRFDTGDGAHAVAVAFAGPGGASATASCAGVGLDCALSAPFEMDPSAPPGSYLLSYAGAPDDNFDIRHIHAEARP